MASLRLLDTQRAPLNVGLPLIIAHNDQPLQWPTISRRPKGVTAEGVSARPEVVSPVPQHSRYAEAQRAYVASLETRTRAPAKSFNFIPAQLHVSSLDFYDSKFIGEGSSGAFERPVNE